MLSPKVQNNQTTTARYSLATNSGVVMVEHDGAEWQIIGHTLTDHAVTSIAYSTGTLLAGTRQGLFRSTNGRQSWQASNDGLTVHHVRWLATNPQQPGRVYVGTEPAELFLSDDNGTTWRACPDVAQIRDRFGWYLPYSPKAGCIRAFAFGGERVYAAAEVGGLLRSDDSGKHWTLVPGSDGIPRFGTPAAGFIHPDVHSVVVHPLSPDLVYCPTGGGFYRSFDGGQTWVERYRCYCREVWVDPADPNHIVLGPADDVGVNGRIEESFDGGHTWHLASVGLVVPWPEAMLQRILQSNNVLLAVLDDGRLLEATLPTLNWQHILPTITQINAIVQVSG